MVLYLIYKLHSYLYIMFLFNILVLLKWNFTLIDTNITSSDYCFVCIYLESLCPLLYYLALNIFISSNVHMLIWSNLALCILVENKASVYILSSSWYVWLYSFHLALHFLLLSHWWPHVFLFLIVPGLIKVQCISFVFS